MKTFIVHVRERRTRSVGVTKTVVVAETGEKAIELVKGYYGPNVKGWAENAEFVLVGEIPSNTVKFV